MVTKKPRIVIIGTGMAGLAAATKLHTSTNSAKLFDLTVVEGGTRIGGRINSSEFCGDRIEQGATWIHGIVGSPLHQIAKERNLLHSHHPWECMDGTPAEPVTVAEGGHLLSPSTVEPISTLFKTLMDFIREKKIDENGANLEILKHCNTNCGDEKNLSVGSFLRKGLEAYWGMRKDQKGIANWGEESIEEAIFRMHESIQRSYSAADDLGNLDCDAEREFRMFPGEEITVARGYSSVVESLASDLPVGMLQLGKKVDRIEWRLSDDDFFVENGDESGPVRLHFSNGSIMCSDHVIITVSLGVLKHGISKSCGNSMFNPPLPSWKSEAISRLGFGFVNKVFLQLPSHGFKEFPFLQMVFHEANSKVRDFKIPNWIRRTSLLYPIYTNSRVLVSWFAGKEALEIESLTEEEIIDGFSAAASNLLSSSKSGFGNGDKLKFDKVLRTQWGSDPLFLGSYSYVAVGSSGDDMDILAEPLPKVKKNVSSSSIPQLQILFAGEATHRTHYSTTHGAYLSGLREARRLLKHYGYIDE